MRPIIITALISILITSTCLHSIYSKEQSAEPIKIEQPQTYRIYVKYKNEKNKECIDFSTAFFIKKNEDTYLITAQHCIKNINEKYPAYIEFGENSYKIIDIKTPIQIVENANVDFVAVKLNKLPFKPYIFKVGYIAPGDDVKIIGFPNSDKQIENQGTVIDCFIDANIPAVSGFSGGPYVNENNEVVGIVTLQHIDPKTNAVDSCRGIPLLGLYHSLQ